MSFKSEAEFEKALIELLTTQKGWLGYQGKEGEMSFPSVLKYKTEEELIQNWADILFQNNRSIDKLGDYPLTATEMKQIIDQIRALKTPLKLNGFINGKNVTINRDNPDDKLHFGKPVSLKIYDRREIAGGQSIYQIAEQPEFFKKNPIEHNRRGDITLLINGMPVIHIELKNNVPLSRATYQIEQYSQEGIFTGLFGLVQIFVAMTPDECVYFANNPKPDGTFNQAFFFHWADFNNQRIDDWQGIASNLLSIPMAHQLIGFYTVADDTDGALKVMRSYQYYAANAISNKVSKNKWGEKNIYGGYVWHTTGAGKTMTSFKSAQLIASSGDADKVVFLMDRIELGTQSLDEYNNFANDDESVAATDNTYDLIGKLKSEDPNNILIVTSIQKMSRLKDGNYKNKEKDLEAINKKRMVIIIDECHRSVFGDMLQDIQDTFPDAMFFGFTGTPIFEENQKKDNTTNTVFGDELHRYSIANGITDGNVLGFDPIRAETYKAKDLREEIAFDACHTRDLNEIAKDEKLKATYQYYTTKCPMVSVTDPVSGKITEKGIEDFLPESQYERDEHRKMVVENILDNWMTLSNFGLFHAIFATSSIPEAIEYYRLFKSQMAEDDKLPQLKITALFDPSDNHNAGDIFKSQGVTEILIDYNNRYFGISDKYKKETYSDFKKDVSYRLAHKESYKFIDNQKDKQIDILIVVDQMLTGFDSKWVNTLYVDKMMEYEKIIQSFSRTNRLFGKDKPHGVIKYYRRPFTMEKRIEKAFKLYSGNKPFGIFVCKLKENIDGMNQCFNVIQKIFSNAGYPNFDKLPSDENDCAMFAKQFILMNRFIESAKVQGYRLNIQDYDFEITDGKREKCHVNFTEHQYNAFLLRYKELIGGTGGGNGGGSNPYPVDGYITEINTGEINANYMNSKFKQFVKVLEGNDSASIQAALDELHNTFGELSADEQKYAQQFLNDVQQGYVKIDDSKSFKDYIAEYETNARNTQIHKFAIAIGIDEQELSQFMKYNVTEQSINEFNRFDTLKSHVNKNTAKAYFEKLEGKTVSMLQVNAKIDAIMRKFILSGGFDL